MSGWNGVGAAYAASYADLCAGTTQVIVQALGAGAQRTLLDVGSGTGSLAAKLAEDGWVVTGCEPEPTMRSISSMRHPNVPVICGTLPSLAFADGAFDCVTANFVLNHVNDPRRSAAEMLRVTTAGGIVIATTWTATPSLFWVSVCERAGLGPATGECLPADKDFERSCAGFGRMLQQSGWQDLTVSETHWTWHANAEVLWSSVTGGVAGAGAFFLSLDERDRRQFQLAFDELCNERVVDGTIALEHSAAVATGHAG
ncbi:class I SAM-dependent methyltransferase [Microbacterium sp. A204]|uniref:class I SAM-dependent methyltransferase n=1 Tax=Microbacterium sp. A204 TaxID=3457321 RepID=UPI003FCF5ED0